MFEKKEMTAQELQSLQEVLPLRKENRKAIADRLEDSPSQGHKLAGS